MAAADRVAGHTSQPSTIHPLFDSLATLLSRSFNFLAVCLENKAPSAPFMKMLLLAISATESRDPRDPTAIATNLLNLCHSSCSDSSTATLLAMAVDPFRTSRSGPASIVQRFCTSPLSAMLWKHANNSPRECSDSMITYVGSQCNGMGITPCTLSSMLPVYVAMCDAKAIQCEESFLSMTVEAQACNQTVEGNSACSADCSAFVSKVSSGSKCMESALSIQEVVAHAAQQTCGDSGKHAVILSALYSLYLVFDFTLA